MVHAGTCRDLTPEQVAEKRRKRALARAERTITFTDGVYGEYTECSPRSAADFIIRRSDGVFAYQLAVVVDDGLSGATEVARARSHRQYAAPDLAVLALFGFHTAQVYLTSRCCATMTGAACPSAMRTSTSAFWGEVHRAGHRRTCLRRRTDRHRRAVAAKGARESVFVGEDSKHELYLPNVFRDIEKIENGKWRMENYRKVFRSPFCLSGVTFMAYIYIICTDLCRRMRQGESLTSIIIRRCWAY